MTSYKNTTGKYAIYTPTILSDVSDSLCSGSHFEMWPEWAGMTLISSGTGMENFIPKVWEHEGNEKSHFWKWVLGRGKMIHSKKTRKKEGNEKTRPIRERIKGMVRDVKN